MAVVEVTMPIAFPHLGRSMWHYMAYVFPSSGTILFRGDVYANPVSHDVRVSPATGKLQRVTDPLTPNEFSAVPWNQVRYISVGFNFLRFEFPFEGVQLQSGAPRVYDMRLTKKYNVNVTSLQRCVRRKLAASRRHRAECQECLRQKFAEWRRQRRFRIVTEGLSFLLGDLSAIVAKFDSL
jgi:hypothetical protein